MKKIKDLAIVWESEYAGGVNKHIYYLLDNKKFKDVNITIFTNNQNQGLRDLKEDLNTKNIKFKLFNSLLLLKIPLLGFIFKPILFIFTVMQFLIYFKNNRFDSVLLQCGGYGTLRSEQAAAISAKICNIKSIVMVIHHYCRKPPFFQNTLMKIIDYVLTNIIDRLIFVSVATKNSVFFNSHLMDSAKIKSSVILNGFKSIENYKKNNHKNKNFAIVSRFDNNKGQDILLQTISQLDDEVLKNVNFLFIGRNLKNNYHYKLKQFINDNKIPVKIINDYEKSIGKLLSDIDLIIMNTQDFEGFGYIAVEALSVGIPVISTKVGAANEILKDTAAKLINPGDINELKNKIIDIHKNYDDYAKEAYAGKKIIEQKYNSNIMSENFYNILNLSLNV